MASERHEYLPQGAKTVFTGLSSHIKHRFSAANASRSSSIRRRINVDKALTPLFDTEI
jgi:hypothetical protein